MTDEEQKLAAIHHIVHDYTNLVSSGTLTQEPLKPPLNTHVQHAFLMNCRKMAAFFLNRRDDDDILSKEFLPTKVGFKLDEWENWGAAMNRQLLHLSYRRIDAAKPWDGKPNKLLLAEFQRAWKKFLFHLEDPYRPQFEIEISAKLKPGSEFNGLDLR